MCGIAGSFGLGASTEPQVRSLTGALAHRGPDGEGFFFGGEVGLGHRRLSIIDLAGGAQPLRSADGRLALICNGEIYNYRELRARYQARGYVFRTHSDCETILALYDEYGRELVQHLDGMFAFALYDTTRRELLLARDPVGIKPLHILRLGDASSPRLLFASEIKAFLALADFRARLDRGALWDFFQLRYVPGPQTLFAGVESLGPGESMLISPTGIRRARYFTPPPPSITGEPVPPRKQALEQVRAQLSDAVRSQLVADVPVGSYLSAGVDSGTVTALACRENPDLRTFTLGFGEAQDENPDAARIAQALGTRHTDMRVTDDLFEQLEAAIWAAEQPKINSVQGYLLARETSRHVKVALSGLGGDELFAGYERTHILWRLRELARFASMTGSAFGSVRRGLIPLLNGFGPYPTLHRTVRGALLLCSLDRGSMADGLLRNTFELAPDALGCPLSREFRAEMATRAPLWQRAEPHFAAITDTRHAGLAMIAGAMHHEFCSKLSDDYLLNEDRNSMAHGLEVRVPLLRVELLTAMRRLPLAWHFEQGRGKALLREAVRPLVPPLVLSRRKQGFQIDAFHHFARAIRPRFCELVDARFMRESGLFDPAWAERVLAVPPHPCLSWHYYTMWMMLGYRLWSRRFLGE